MKDWSPPGGLGRRAEFSLSDAAISAALERRAADRRTPPAWEGGSFVAAVARATFRPTPVEAIANGTPLVGDVFDALAEEMARTLRFDRVVLVYWHDQDFPIRVFGLDANGVALVAAPRRVKRPDSDALDRLGLEERMEAEKPNILGERRADRRFEEALRIARSKKP